MVTAADSSVIVGAMSAALVEARASMTGPYRRLRSDGATPTSTKTI